MRFHHLVLQITDTCPLECAHCCLESGPRRRTSMALDDACSYLHQAKALAPDVLLSLTGGEPFVQYTLMRAIAGEADALGIPFTVVTSAVWCKSKDLTRARLAQLQGLGLTGVSVSYDSFHQPWVTPEQVRHCITAAMDLGLTVAITGSVARGTCGARDLLGDLATEFPDLPMIDGPVQPTGRGQMIPLESLLVEDWGATSFTCPVPGELFIRTDGTTYPCCSTGGDYQYLILGNARQTPLAELRARAERSLWFRFITTGGFAALEQVVRRYYPDAVFPRQHVGVCHLCQLVFGPGELGTRVRDALARYEAERSAAAVGLWEQIAAALQVSAVTPPPPPLHEPPRVRPRPVTPALTRSESPRSRD